MTLSSAASWKRTLGRSWAYYQSGLPALACVFIQRRRRWSYSGSQSQSGIGTWERHIRVSRLHPLLGTNTSGVLGHQTQNSQETAPAYPAGVVAMVSPQSSCASAIPVSDAVREAARALSVLRDWSNLPVVEDGRCQCGKAWREWVGPAWKQESDDV